jgi:ribonucleoside-diphosphate reductase alpha chain
MFARVATAFADDADHAQRVYDYMSRLWFMPATPVLSNGGADRGLPISCFLNAVNDSLDGIQGVWNENVAGLQRRRHRHLLGRRPLDRREGQGRRARPRGIIPFIRVMDSLTLAISQGSLRRGSAAVYLDIHHPEIEEFLEIRKPSGDFNRKSLNLHHGISSPTSSWTPCATARSSACARPRPTRWCARSTPAPCGRRSWRSACRPASPT